MKKVLTLLLAFSLTLIGCEKDLHQNDQVVENQKFDLNWISKDANLKKILSFLDVTSLKDLKYEVGLENIYNPVKGEVLDEVYVVLTENNDSKSKGDLYKGAILKVNPETKGVDLISLLSNDSINGKISIDLFDKGVIVESYIVDYNLEKEFFDFYTSNKHLVKGDCMYNCFHKRMQAVEDGNWVDKAKFIASLPLGLLWDLGACGWECA